MIGKKKAHQNFPSASPKTEKSTGKNKNRQGKIFF
jgi:hypothetical protein